MEQKLTVIGEGEAIAMNGVTQLKWRKRYYMFKKKILGLVDASVVLVGPSFFTSPLTVLLAHYKARTLE